MPDPLKQTISATQAPALFGVSPYVTRWMLYRHFAHGDPIDSPEHNRMNWGKRMQPLLLAAAAEDLHLEVRANATDDYVRRDLLGCTRDADIICPDRGPGALETKCAFDYSVWMHDWAGGKTPPRHNEIQLQVQMMVGDGRKPYEWGVLAAWVGGEMHYFERKSIPELWTELETEADKFFADVKAGREPDPFGAPVEMPLLHKVFPTQKGLVGDFTTRPDAEKLTEGVRMMSYHSRERLGHEKAEKELKAKIAGLLKDASEGKFLHGVRATITQSARAGYQVKPTTTTTIKVFVPEGTPIPDTRPAPQNILAGG